MRVCAHVYPIKIKSLNSRRNSIVVNRYNYLNTSVKAKTYNNVSVDYFVSRILDTHSYRLITVYNKQRL